MMDDNRIGKIGHSWPETTVSGRAYTRPCSTRTLGNGCFVVLDVFPEPEQDMIVLALSQTIMQSKGSKRGTREESSEDA